MKDKKCRKKIEPNQRKNIYFIYFIFSIFSLFFSKKVFY